ncbi:flagellar biosynthesis anti-sigma factor FlgM [Paenibacillus sp. TRM 82003]|nr:flagellar biosynthesis anti-sigma factor FlgM [Paenibacillus sp. TRM 82003]MCI3923393.1 flagellar biosynthesis anti-sigma factor FlgM [Paenibacillus sp. TRM 82003]
MKINETGRISSIQAYNKGASSKDAKSLGGKGAAKDDVRISPEAMELLEAQRSNAGQRSERIEELKASVQSGTYSVSADKVAEKLLPYLK